MKKIYVLFLTCALLVACNDENVENSGSGSSVPENSLSGYADPNGILILNQGTYTLENAFLSYLAPDGTIEADAYRNANGTELGNDGVAL